MNIWGNSCSEIPIALSGSHSNTIFQGFAASDLRDRTDEERKAAWASGVKDLLAKKRRNKLKGKSVKGIEGQIKALRERLRSLKKWE